MTDDFETQHSRDDRNGRFVVMDHPEPAAGVLGTPSRTPDVTLTVRRERWGRNDYLEQTGSDDFDGRKILDTASVALIEHSRDIGDADWVYEVAVDAGLVESDEGNPFTIELDTEAVDDYLEFRRSHGLNDAIIAAVPFARDAQRKFMAEQLTTAYNEVSVSEILKLSDKTAIQERFRKAATTLNLASIDPRVGILDFGDSSIIAQVQSVALRDPELPAFTRIAIDTAADYADWIISREKEFAASDAEAAARWTHGCPAR